LLRPRYFTETITYSIGLPLMFFDP
jgi:hypothetical protein